jgi:hypothetical protein
VKTTPARHAAAAAAAAAKLTRQIRPRYSGFEDKQNSRKGGAIADAGSPALRRSTVSRKMSFYKRPKVFGEKCLGHGIGSFANKAAMIMPELWPCTSAIDPKQPLAAIQEVLQQDR